MLLDHGLDQGNRQTLNCRRGLYDRASSETRECAVIEGVNELESSNIPLLAPPQGGVAERSRRCREASTEREGGVVFRLRKRRKTTPSASVSVASRNFINDAATPPCGDARRGICHSHKFRYFFTTRMIPLLPGIKKACSDRTAPASNKCGITTFLK